MFQKEVKTSKWSYERARNGEYDDHGKDEHHSGVMFSKPKLQPDGPSDGRKFSFALRQTNLDQIPNHFWKPEVKLVIK